MKNKMIGSLLIFASVFYIGTAAPQRGEKDGVCPYAPPQMFCPPRPDRPNNQCDADADVRSEFSIFVFKCDRASLK